MMKKFKDYEEEIYKCSRCGLCQSVCPVYQVTLNECSVSKAKFTMLNGILKGDLALNKRIKMHMDMCIGCNACKDFCPSNIDAREIFTAVKCEYYKKNKPTAFEKIADSYFLFKFALGFAKFSFGIYRFFRLSKIAEACYSFLNKQLLLLNSLIKDTVKSTVPPIQSHKKAVYFAGCFNNYLNPSSKNALTKIFNQIGIELVEKSFECCGVSYLSAGKIEEFNKLAKKNIKALNKDYDYVLTDCASCNYVLKEYKKYLPSKEADELSQRTTNVLEFLKGKRIVAKKPITVTVHKPCHEDFDFIEIIKNIENVEYKEAGDFDKCCGFSGKFALNYPEISKEISKRKAQKIIETGADCIITTCPACVLGINQGLIENKEDPKAKNINVYNLIEFIALYCKVMEESVEKQSNNKATQYSNPLNTPQ